MLYLLKVPLSLSADLTLGQGLIVALFTLPAALQQRHAGSARNLDAAGVAAGTMQWMTGTLSEHRHFSLHLGTFGGSSSRKRHQ